MRSETPPETINREALLFGLMVGAIATVAMALIGGVPFLIALLGGGALAIVVWFIVVKLGGEAAPPRGEGNIDASPLEITPIAPREMPEPVVVSPELQASPPSAAPAAPAATAGTKPATLSGARDGGPDDLKQLKGVGPKLEEMLHSMGYFHFDQIAAWTSDEVAWVDENLEGFKGRVSRDDWVGQAKELSVG
ncbi:MAG: NADH:ubiquinone oxidoreductase [Pseudomonadota bacterium]